MLSREAILAVYKQGPEAVVELVGRLSAQLDAVDGRVKALEDRHTLNSHNSSKPPSTDSDLVREAVTGRRCAPFPRLREALTGRRFAPFPRLREAVTGRRFAPCTQTEEFENQERQEAGRTARAQRRELEVDGDTRPDS